MADQQAEVEQGIDQVERNLEVEVYAALTIASMLAAPDQEDLTTALSPAYFGPPLCKVLGAALGGWWIGRRRAPA